MQQHRTIVRLILNRRLKEALKKIENQMNLGSTTELRNEHNQISTSYEYMLKYMAQGVQDPERQKLYNGLLRDALSLNERVRAVLLTSSSSRLYYLSRREELYERSLGYDEIQNVLASFNDDYAVASLMDYEQLEPVLKKREEANRQLFNKVWLNTQWHTEDVENIKNLLNAKTINATDKGLLISAITLSLMECFDEEKIKMLMNGYKNPTTEVNQRSLVGIAIIFQKYSDWLSFYPEIIAQIEFLNESDSFGEDLNRVYIQLLRSQDTKEIERKMKEEIFPEMMKVSSFEKFNFDDLEAADEEMKNWEEKLEDSDFGEKIKEMQELQMQGEDIYMSTFSHLKNYPFFKTFHHWFYPFDKYHSSIIKELGLSNEKSNPIMDIILESSIFCNSDKYSLCFMLQHIPQNQKEMMLSQLSEEQQARLEEEKKELSADALNPKFIANQYIHDLYRFYKLSDQRKDFEDFFDKKMNLHKVPLLKEVLYTSKHLTFLADFFLFKERYLEAIEVFRILIQEMELSSFLLYQKYGFACQREKRYQEAIEAYLKADLISPNSLWIYRNLALCYRRIQSYPEAIDYYKKVEEIQPQHKNTLYYIGVCLTNLERYDEALNYFFKLDLMDNDNPRTWRSIGWCSFLTYKIEQAERYYSRVLTRKPLMIDFLNAGHIAWASKNLDLAISRYKKALELSKDREVYIEKMNSDKKHLMKYGIPEEDIPLMIDLI